MPQAIYLDIYNALKAEILDGTFPYQSLLPSEAELTERFSCSRSSVRRALKELAEDGYVQPIHGKGVRVIRNPRRVGQGFHTEGGLETYGEMAQRRGFKPSTRTFLFRNEVADEELAARTGFAPGDELTHTMRVRYADDKAVGTDESYYLASSVPGLTAEIVNESIYRYLEDVLGMHIVTSKRRLTVEGANELDLKLIDFEDVKALAVMRCNTYDSNGLLMEYTETRQRAGFFELDMTSMRRHVALAEDPARNA